MKVLWTIVLAAFVGFFSGASSGRPEGHVKPVGLAEFNIPISAEEPLVVDGFLHLKGVVKNEGDEWEMAEGYSNCGNNLE